MIYNSNGEKKNHATQTRLAIEKSGFPFFPKKQAKGSHLEPLSTFPIMRHRHCRFSNPHFFFLEESARSDHCVRLMDWRGFSRRKRVNGQSEWTIQLEGRVDQVGVICATWQ